MMSPDNIYIAVCANIFFSFFLNLECAVSNKSVMSCEDVCLCLLAAGVSPYIVVSTHQINQSPVIPLPNVSVFFSMSLQFLYFHYLGSQMGEKYDLAAVW